MPTHICSWWIPTTIPCSHFDNYKIFISLLFVFVFKLSRFLFCSNFGPYILEDLHLVGYVTWTFHNRCNLRTSFCCKILLRIIFFPPEILHWKSISSFSPSLSTIQLAKHLLLIITLNRRFYILLVPTTSCKLLLDTISH